MAETGLFADGVLTDDQVVNHSRATTHFRRLP